jgi:hypothetical protein
MPMRTHTKSLILLVPGILLIVLMPFNAELNRMLHPYYAYLLYGLPIFGFLLGLFFSAITDGSGSGFITFLTCLYGLLLLLLGLAYSCVSNLNNQLQ